MRGRRIADPIEICFLRNREKFSLFLSFSTRKNSSTKHDIQCSLKSQVGRVPTITTSKAHEDVPVFANSILVMSCLKVDKSIVISNHYHKIRSQEIVIWEKCWDGCKFWIVMEVLQGKCHRNEIQDIGKKNVYKDYCTILF